MTEPVLDPVLEGGRRAVDVDAEADAEVIEVYELDLEGDDTLHVEDEFAVPDDTAEPTDERVISRGDEEALVDAFVEGYNARDLDMLVDLLARDAELPALGGDVDGFEVVIEELWERLPSSTLTRGDLAGSVVAVMWVRDDAGEWWRTALLVFEAEDDSQLGLVELAADAAELEDVVVEEPDHDSEEGARWEEWSEGVGP